MIKLLALILVVAISAMTSLATSDDKHSRGSPDNAMVASATFKLALPETTTAESFGIPAILATPFRMEPTVSIAPSPAKHVAYLDDG